MQDVAIVYIHSKCDELMFYFCGIQQRNHAAHHI